MDELVNVSIICALLVIVLVFAAGISEYCGHGCGCIHSHNHCSHTTERPVIVDQQCYAEVILSNGQTSTKEIACGDD